MQQGQQGAMNFDLNDGRDIACSCGNLIFMPGARVKKFSRLLTGEPEDTYLPIQLYLCTACGKPLQEIMPEELRDKKIAE
jgi:DNA-directed RNA polymerase subunit RPC12/RpoP